MGDETPVLDAPTPAPADVALRVAAEPAAVASVGSTLLDVQRRAGNRAAVALANRMVQRHPAGPGVAPHNHPHDIAIEDYPLEPYEVGEDPILEMRVLDVVFYGLSLLQWNEAGRRLHLPEEIFTPVGGLILTENKRIVVDTYGNPRSISDNTVRVPATERRAYVIQMRTGDTWILMARAGGIAETHEAGKIPPIDDPTLSAGKSALVITMPGVRVTPEQEAEIRRMIRNVEAAVRRAAGPPGWARQAYTRLQRRRGGAGTTGEGPGAGQRGEGAGGGGESDTVEPGTDQTDQGTTTEPTDEGAGAGDEAADATSAAPPGTPGVDRPYTEDERRQRVTTSLKMNNDGRPVVEVSVDRAKGTVPMRSGESDEDLDRRIAELEQQLADSRDPRQSIGIQGGPRTASVAARGPAGTGGGREVATEEAQRTGARGEGAPDEMIPGASIANHPPWPARLELYGMGDITKPLTTVVGAANQAAMILNRGTDVFDYFQHISYSWELIDVTGKSDAERRAAPSQAKFHSGTVIGPASGQWRHIVRTQENILEDIEAESWPERAAAWQLIGLSAGIRTIGSVISSFVSLLTQPQNERSIAWGQKGEFILRAVATPVPSDKAKADPDHHIIRGSSIKCIPMRVAQINELATEVNDREQTELQRLEAQLAAAKADPARANEVDELQRRVDALKAASRDTATGRISRTVTDLARQVKFLEILQENEAPHALDDAGAIQRRYELTQDAYVELLEFAVGLAFQGYSPRTLLPQMRTSLAALRKQDVQAARWSFEIKSVDGDPGIRRTNYRPQLTLVSEENGQAIPMIAMLGEAVGSTDANQHWILFDVTSDKTQRRYHGYSTQGGRAGTIEAIRNAFVDFRENAEYGRGSIAIRLPANLHEDLGFTVPIEATMRAAPGETARWMQRLEHLALAAGIAALVVAAVVTGGAAAAIALGVVGGLAGGAVAIHRMSNRAEGDRLRLDYDTFVDILGIVGAVAAVVGPLASAAAAVGRATVVAAREAGDVARLMRAATWVQRAEMTARGLHIFGIVQNVGQIVIQVPYEIIRQFEEIDKEEAQNPMGSSPGQRRARRAMVLLNGFQSGMIAVVSLGQSLVDPAPRVTPDSEIYAHAAVAAGRTPVDTPALTPGGDRPPTVPSPDAPTPTVPTVTDAPTVPDAPGTGRRPPPDGDPGTQGRRIPVDPPPGVDRPVPGDDAPPPVNRPSGDDVPPPVEQRPDGDTVTARPGTGTPATPPPPSGPVGRALNATQLVARVREIVTADRGEPPPAGRIRIVDGATLATQTGHPAGTLAVHDPASGQLVVNRELVHGTAGLPERLQALVEARAHRTGRQGLGEPVADALMRRVVADVFGEGSGFPVGADSPIGQRLLDLLQATVGIRPLLDALFHGSIGSVRDALRERFGHTRTEAILDAVRTGSIAEVARLTTPERGALAESYGRPFADGVADLLNDHGDRPGADRPAKALARELADLAGVQALRDAYFAGDVAALDRALDARLGTAARRTLADQIAAGDIAGARRTLADAAAGRTQVATVPAQAAEPSARFVDSLTGAPEGSRAPATDLITSLADFRSLRRLVDNGAVGGSDVVAAARDRIQAARMAIVDSALDVVKRGVEERIPGVRLRFQDLGTPGFGSDRDVTLVAESANPDAPVPVPDLVRASSEAVRDAYDQLRSRGYEPDVALDTNFYTELHEGGIQPANASERRAISSDQTVVSLTEIAINTSAADLMAVRDSQLAAIDRSGAPDDVRAQMRTRVEQQFAQAEQRAAALTEGGREAGLRRARERLEDALQRQPPASARELRQLMADVKLLEPDAYGTRAAVEGVVYGQQGMTRAQTPDQQRRASEHVGPARRGPEGLTEQLEHRLAQSRAALAHLIGHLPATGRAAPRDVAALAKQLNRIAHAFFESGLVIENPLIDDAGSVVAAKQESPDAIIREVRVWAERTGQRFGTDQERIDAYMSAGRRLAIEMTSRMGVGAETVRMFEPDATPPGDGPASPPVPPVPPAPDGPGAPRRGGDGDYTSNAPSRPGQRPDEAGAPARTPTPPAERPAGQLAAHEVAHNQFLERLTTNLTTPFDPPPASGRPLRSGEVGRFNAPDAAYDAFRSAVARAGGREVGLFYNPDTGTYAVVVGSEGRVGPPETGGPWECPIHTHPNPEQVLTYRMPAPQDVFLQWRAALRKNAPDIAFIEYALPDGRRGHSRLEIHPDGTVIFDWPDADGVLRTERLTHSEYQERWDDRTRYVDPDSTQYDDFIRDIDDYRRDHPPGDNDFTSTGRMPDLEPGRPRREPSESNDPNEAEQHTRDVDEQRTRQRGDEIDADAARQAAIADSPGFRTRLQATRRRLRSWRTEVENDPSPPENLLAVIDDLAHQLDHIEAGVRDGSVGPEALDDLQATITQDRRRLRLGPRQTIPDDRLDYEVRLRLTDPATKASVVAWFETETTEVLGLPGGEYLRQRMLAQLRALDEIVLSQSPRSAGIDIADTAAMRRRVAEWMRANRYPAEFVLEFNANLGPDGWPVSADNRVWEVDHVLELWAGGEDSPANYLPLHPDVHAIKSEILGRFREIFRDRLRVDNEQVEVIDEL